MIAGRNGQMIQRLAAMRPPTNSTPSVVRVRSYSGLDIGLTFHCASPRSRAVFAVGHHSGRTAMPKTYDTLEAREPQPHTLQVTLNRPEAANAMNTQMGIDLLALFDSINAAPSKQRCIVLTGAGGRAFCAGGDLKERNGMTDQQWQDQHLIFERAIRAIIQCPVPVIAAVNGAAYAGGMEIALCADFIYAAEHARFALTEVTLGIMPGAGGTQNL